MYSPSWKGPTTLFPLPLLRLTFPWPPTLGPHQLRRKLRSRIHAHQSPASTSLSALNTSLNPSDTLDALHAHHWTLSDAQYLLLATLLILAFSLIEAPGILVKTLIGTLLVLTLALPATQQFFLPFLPIATWLIFFYSCSFIPRDWRPPIWVRVLPRIENALFGANLSNVFAAHQSTLLDVLAWLPYGIIHFGAPAACSIALFVFGPPGTLPVFARSFGYMNLVGVTIQLLLPCSPPWYENRYGLAPADYGMPGSPAGLGRVDRLFGTDLYTSSFTASPMVFGAFPSLHAGSATLEALFLSHAFPQFRACFVLYTAWLWWATMYLSHHYAVDLVGGSILAALVYHIAKTTVMPQRQAARTYRWDYDYTVRFHTRRPSLDVEKWVATSAVAVESSSSCDDETGSWWDGETSMSMSMSRASSDIESYAGEHRLY